MRLTQICFLLLALLPSCCSNAFGQIELSYSLAKSLVGATAPEIVVGGRILMDADSKVSESLVAIIRVSSSERVRLKAMRSLKEYGELIPLTQTTADGVTTAKYILAGEGTYLIDAMSPTWDRTLEVTIGKQPDPIPPIPPPTPTPDVPADEFDNVGQRIAVWSAGLPKRIEVGNVFLKYSKELVTNPTMDITKAMSLVSTDRLAVLGTDATKYTDCVDKLNADIKARWPMSKGVLSDYLKAVSVGFGAK